MSGLQRITFTATCAILAACASSNAPNEPRSVPAIPHFPEYGPMRAPSFEDDVAFLSRHGEIEILSRGGSRIAVSPKYQARVMTSAVAPGAESLGFVHRSFIDEGKTGTKFDNYGGEDRLWIGPEGGQFGLFFAPGSTFTFDAWQTPADMQLGPWKTEHRDLQSIVFTHSMRLMNWSGTKFAIDVLRTITLLDENGVSARLGIQTDPRVAWVAFESTNQVTNAGDAPWTDDTGLVSIWILGMFAPAPDARVIVPFERDGTGPIVNDAYFGKVPSDRLVVHKSDGYLVFTADGKLRSKIGLGFGRAKSAIGSFSASQKLLTIVQYNRRTNATQYVNSTWQRQAAPYEGDVINSYNDGPTGPGQPSLGGFYEMETSSPAAALTPGASVVHVHRTYHFVGQRAALDAIARRILGVSLDEISSL